MKQPEHCVKHRDYDVPVRIYEHPGITIQGFSRAAFLSYWRIPELKIGFDLGGLPSTFASTDTWALSHTHVDHIAGLPSYLARRDILNMKPPRVFLPAEKVDEVRAMLEAWERVQEYQLPVELIGVTPGERYRLRTETYLTCFRTDHTIVSCGYIVWSERHKLRKEFLNLESDEIKRLREDGVAINDTVATPMVAYTGDTRINSLRDVEAARRARVLITECTFLRSDTQRSKASEYGHLHMQDLAEISDLFENELIVLGHFSSIYSPEEIVSAANMHLPKSLKDRVVLWI